MGLNYLLHRHQLSLMNATATKSVEARASHHALARGYARRIDDLVGAARAAGRPAAGAVVLGSPSPTTPDAGQD